MMVRLWVVLVILGLAGCNGGFNPDDDAPYVWPTPPYGVPWTSRSFTLRYSEEANVLEQVRAEIAELCGSEFDTARVFPQRYSGPVIHPHAIRVICGSPPPAKPEFRGQAISPSELISLKPGGSGGEFFKR